MTASRSLVFPKSRRLVHASEFERVKKEGEVERGRFLMLGVLQVQDSGPFRAGLVVARRIGSATSRNRVKRRLRDIVRRHQHELRSGIWIVVIARAGAAQADYRALEDEWLRLVTRASILSA